MQDYTTAVIEEIAVWLGCNPMQQDPTLCAINTVLITPGVLGMFLVMILYLMAIPIGTWAVIAYLYRITHEKITNRESDR